MNWRRELTTFLLATLVAITGNASILVGEATFYHREQAVLLEINRIRQEHGLPQLRMNYELRSIARRHSSNMADSGSLSHTDSLGRDFRERLGARIAPRYYAGENLACNNSPNGARVAVQGWRRSPKHLKNILNERFTETGIGVATNSEGLVFFTQIFLGK
jgi:uncharacterized protein YkwD